MELSTHIFIDSTKEKVWETITNFEAFPSFISVIQSLVVIEKTEGTLNGFKWKETRVMFGKEAEETMWITDYKDYSFYQMRAESHGSIYTSRLEIKEVEGNRIRLEFIFKGEALSFMAKLMSKLMGWMMIGSMKKALQQDLADIKKHIEG